MLKGKTALITGTNRGIGKAILEEYAKNNADIIAHARCYSMEFENFIEEIANKYKITVTPIYFNMVDTQTMKEKIKNLIKEKKQIDILVNSAGKSHGAFFQMTPISKIKEIFDINLFAQMELTQLILKSMTRMKSGSIINISSISGYDLKSGNSAYGVSKAALIAWTKTLASECATFNIRVNSIAPGLIRTDMFDEMEKKAQDEVIKSSSMGRLGNSTEIASTALFFASEASSFITGQTIRVDGGII